MPAKGKKRKTKVQKAEELARIATLHARGKTRVGIAKELGISRQWVDTCLVKIYEGWEKLRKGAGNRLLAEANEVREEAWSAWERSKENAEIRTQRIRKVEAGGQGAPVEVAIRTEGQVGDATYLRHVEWANEREAKILGTDAPDRVETKDTTYDGPAGLERLERALAVLDALTAQDSGTGPGEPGPGDGPEEPDPVLGLHDAETPGSPTPSPDR